MHTLSYLWSKCQGQHLHTQAILLFNSNWVFESMIFYKPHDYLHHQCSVICSYYSTLTFLPFKLCNSCYQWSISVFHIFIGNEQPITSTTLPLSQIQKAFGIILGGLHYSNPLVLWFLLYKKENSVRFKPFQSQQQWWKVLKSLATQLPGQNPAGILDTLNDSGYFVS